MGIGDETFWNWKARYLIWPKQLKKRYISIWANGFWIASGILVGLPYYDCYYLTLTAFGMTNRRFGRYNLPRSFWEKWCLANHPFFVGYATLQGLQDLKSLHSFRDPGSAKLRLVKHAHRIHGTGIFTYIYHKNQPWFVGIPKGFPKVYIPIHGFLVIFTGSM